MAVKIQSVEKHSPCAHKRIQPGDELLQINGHDIIDVLDYRFFMQAEKLDLQIRTTKGKCVILRYERMRMKS